MLRLREFDFLRGAALLLIFLRHIPLFSFTKNMGWIGVDLFFVLSGFLVSGLLFKEYLKFGTINTKLFLIRRGFKIYPIYFIFYPLYFTPIFNYNFDIKSLMGDLTFTQNYITGWGYAYAASWSLAVEEHFYILLVVFFWIGLRFKNKLIFKITVLEFVKKNIISIISLILILVLALRIISNLISPEQIARNFTMTHLRIDSLLCGVLISYIFYFKREDLEYYFKKYKSLLYIICILGIAWTPFIDPLPSFFVKTFGFTFLYLSFGIILLMFLLIKNINTILDKILTSQIVDFVSKVGYCSYAIYIIHTLVIKICRYLYVRDFNHYIFFLMASSFSIIVGILITYSVEKYFLKLRNKYFPNRVL